MAAALTPDRAYLTVYEAPGGTTVEVNSGGDIVSITQKYFFLMDNTAASSGAAALSFLGLRGLPQVGSAHGVYPRLLVRPYTLRRKEGADCNRWEVDVTWALSEASGANPNTENNPPVGQAEQSREYGSNESAQDLCADAVTGEALLNSAGDPFDSVPQRTMFGATIRRVVKSDTPPSTYAGRNGCVNDSALTIDGFSFPVHGALLRVTSRVLWADPDGYQYEHTFELIGRRTLVEDGGSVVDIGWDYAFVQAGLYYLDSGVRKRATETDSATGEPRPTAKPVLLNSSGERLAAGSDPVIRRVAMYPETANSNINALVPDIPHTEESSSSSS